MLFKFSSALGISFSSHKQTMDKMVAVMLKITDEAALKIVYDVFDVIVLYFFFCAAGILLILALLYWFGKVREQPTGIIITRIMFLTIIC